MPPRQHEREQRHQQRRGERPRVALDAGAHRPARADGGLRGAGLRAQARRGGKPYGGRFFAAYDVAHARQYDAAFVEWEARKDNDLRDYWPRSEVPYGFMTHMNNGGIPNHGYTHWWTMFNPRQLLIHAQLLKAIVEAGSYDWKVREYVLGSYQQYLRNQNMFCFWDISRDGLAPHMSNNNYHPKSNIIENCVFSSLGRGNWISCVEGVVEGGEWATTPWESVAVESLIRRSPELGAQIAGKSEKVYPRPQGDERQHPGRRPAPAVRCTMGGRIRDRWRVGGHRRDRDRGRAWRPASRAGCRTPS